MMEKTVPAKKDPKKMLIAKSAKSFLFVEISIFDLV